MKGTVYIGSEEKRMIMRGGIRLFDLSGVSGPACASITPTAATRPQQLRHSSRGGGTNTLFLKETRWFAPQILSFTSPSFSRHVPCHSKSIIFPDSTGHTALSHLSHLFIPKPAETVMSLAINTSRPLVSSPLASPTSPSRQTARTLPIRKPSFPASRPLRPFPSITTAVVVNGTRGATKKPVKIIEPPKNYSGGCFVLNLTQAELSRRD